MSRLVRTRLFLPVVATALAVAGCGGTHSRGSARLGKAIVSSAGEIGSLNLDRSTAADIERVEGKPAFIGTGSFDDAFAGFPKTYRALGYGCDGRRATGIDPGAYRRTGTYCRTVYYLNPHTNKLGAFWTDSVTFRTRAGTRPGSDLRGAVRLERAPAYAGARSGISHITRVAQLILEVDCRKWSRNLPEPECLAGRISDFALESRHHGVGLLFE